LLSPASADVWVSDIGKDTASAVPQEMQHNPAFSRWVRERLRIGTATPSTVLRLEGFVLWTNSSDVQLLEQSDAGYHLYI